MSEYLQRFKELGDALVVYGTPVDGADLVYHTRCGLLDALEPFIDSIEVQIDPVLPDELHILLLSKEISLLQMGKRPRIESIFVFHNISPQGFVALCSSSGHCGGAFSSHRGGQCGHCGGTQYSTNSSLGGGSCPSPGRGSFSAPLLLTPSPFELFVLFIMFLAKSAINLEIKPLTVINA